MKKPCKLPCPKCGHIDISRRFYQKGDTLFSALGDRKERKNEFAKYDYYGKDMALKDHIHHCCRCCSYEWEAAVLDMKGKE